jgi:hypothetical protein
VLRRFGVASAMLSAQRIEVLGPGDIAATVVMHEFSTGHQTVVLEGARVRVEANALPCSTRPCTLTVSLRNDAFLVTRLVKVEAWSESPGEDGTEAGVDAEQPAADLGPSASRRFDDPSDARAIPRAEAASKLAATSPVAAAALAVASSPHYAIDPRDVIVANELAKRATDLFFLNDAHTSEAIFA